MNIYFACSITGGRSDQAIYQTIVEYLRASGHDVPTAILANPEVLFYEGIVVPEEVYKRDIDWIETCDALIAEVSTPSHGVGYEIAYALGRGKRVLCCFLQGTPVSKMITGNPDPNLVVSDYRSAEDALRLVGDFLDDIGGD